MARVKRQYPLDFKTMFGVSTMGLAQVLGGGIITGYMMLYITDYSGLFTALPARLPRSPRSCC